MTSVFKKVRETERNGSEHIPQNKGKNHILKLCFSCLAVTGLQWKAHCKGRFMVKKAQKSVLMNSSQESLGSSPSSAAASATMSVEFYS